MNEQTESRSWKAHHCASLDEMVDGIKAGAMTPPLVFMTERDYRRMTEDGVVKALFEWFYQVFLDESEPDEIIRFIRWQMDKLDYWETQHLYEYLYFNLKHSFAEHTYREQWQELAKSVEEYGKKQKEKFEEMRRVLYVCPGKENRVYCLFSNGQWRIWDASSMLDMPLMQKCIQKDPDFFTKALTVINETLAWDRAGDKDPCECLDVDPDRIYAEGQPLTMEALVQLAESTEKKDRK